MNLIRSFYIILALFSATVSAEDEIDAWYLSKGGQYLVKESTGSTIYALLSESKSGSIRVYLTMYDESCEKASEEIMRHNPLKVNGQLVRFSQYCEKASSNRIIYPSTDEGAEYLMREFKNKKFVDIVAHDDEYGFIFSAKNFMEVLKKLSSDSKAI